MATKTVTVRKNADNTLTVKVGSQREHISLDSKTRSEVFDAIKWTAISKGVFLSDIRLIELMQEVEV